MMQRKHQTIRQNMGRSNEVRLSLEQQGALALEVAKPKLKEPSLYQVILLNDDYTPMDFVIEILERFFYMDREKATQIMLTVHTQGQAVCALYPLDTAQTKMAQVNDFSRENQHPLLCQIKAVDA